MLVRASVHVVGLQPGQTADLNGNDKAVRAALNAGYLERVGGEPEDEPVVVYDAPEEPPEADEQDAAEGEPGQDD